MAPPTLSDPRARLSNSFDAELDQYLFGYGDDYGQLSSANVLDQRKSKIMEDEGVRDSVEVNTSLGSENSDAQADHHSDPQLPSEEESVLDQVKRFHSSMEEDTPPHNVCIMHVDGPIFSAHLAEILLQNNQTHCKASISKRLLFRNICVVTACPLLTVSSELKRVAASGAD